MLGKVFSIVVIISFIFAGISGNMDKICDAAISGAVEAVNLSISLLGIMCLWNGVIKVLDTVGFTKVIAKIISPFLRIIFPVASRKNIALGDISASFSANLLGLGNAALPLGIRGISTLSQEGLPRDETANDDMVMFSVLNTTPLQLFPASLIALRNAHMSSNPGEILLPVWICSVATTVFAVIICKMLARVFK